MAMELLEMAEEMGEVGWLGGLQDFFKGSINSFFISEIVIFQNKHSSFSL